MVRLILTDFNGLRTNVLTEAYGQMGGVLYRRLGKTSIMSDFEDIFEIPSRYVKLYPLPFLLCQQSIKHTIKTPCFGSLKHRFDTPPICPRTKTTVKPSMFY